MSRSPPRGSSSQSLSDEAAETREHETFMRTLDPAIVAAADWHTSREDGLTIEEEVRFQRWLEADRSHRLAYSRLDQSFGDLRRMSPGRADHCQGAAMDGVGVPSRPVHLPVGRRRQRRWPAAMAACIAVLVVGGITSNSPIYTHQYVTKRGQSLSAPLPDGSELSLDTATRSTVSLSRDRRELRLDEGQVMVSAAPDGGKPFRVLAGPARITVLGTRFSVRYLPDEARRGEVSGEDDGSNVEVAVEEGRVRIESSPGTGSSRGEAGTTLEAGQRVKIDATGTIGDVVSIPVSSVALWRKGLIRFSNTALSDAIREMERYGPTHLIVKDAAVASLRIGGMYEVARPGELEHLLPQMLPVRLVRRGDGMIEVVKAD